MLDSLIAFLFTNKLLLYGLLGSIGIILILVIRRKKRRNFILPPPEPFYSSHPPQYSLWQGASSQPISQSFEPQYYNQLIYARPRFWRRFKRRGRRLRRRGWRK
ncbi:MAG: hypothetical protein ACTSVA_01875 [Candidatus Njordarchaeales archaeon]